MKIATASQCLALAAVATAPACWIADAVKLPSSCGRRAYLAKAPAAVAVAAAIIATPAYATTSTTVVNSILGGYGLPTLDPTPGFKAVLFESEQAAAAGRSKVLISLAYPKAWVESGAGKDVGAADYQNGDGCRVVIKPAPAETTAELSDDFIATATLPGDSQRAAPEYMLVKHKVVARNGQDYVQNVYRFSTVTRSGYDVERYAWVSATIVSSIMYAVVAQTSLPRKKAMEDSLIQIQISFRARNAQQSL